MKIIKTIVTSIDIINAADCYRPPMDVAMEYLQTKYKGGKCDFGCFISQITKILEVSAAVCDKTRNQGRMLMNVQPYVGTQYFQAVLFQHQLTFSGKDTRCHRIHPEEFPMEFTFRTNAGA
jgi:hypothetical protein